HSLRPSTILKMRPPTSSLRGSALDNRSQDGHVTNLFRTYPRKRHAMSWEFEVLAGPMGLTEGPAWDGNRLLFTNIPNSRIMRYDPQTGTLDVARTDTNQANGLNFDKQGRLYACDGGARRIVR